MLKRILLAVVVLSLCSTGAYAQDVFVTFGQGINAGVDGARNGTTTADVADGTGTAFVYSNLNFDFTAFDLDFSTSDDSVIQFSNAVVFNPMRQFGNNVRWNHPITNTVDATGTSGQLFAVAVDRANGIDGSCSPIETEEGFDTGAAAFRIAQIDYNLVGAGDADITLTLGDRGFNPTSLNPTLGNGLITVTGDTAAVPEPSSAAVLALGFAGFLVRRRRS